MAGCLKDKIAALNIFSDRHTIKFTASVGCAMGEERSRDVEDIIQRTDKALYTAK
jgi:PleD family two-component response regulator